MKYIKKIIFVFVLCLCLLPLTCKAETNDVTLHLFYRDGCSHCSKEKEFLKEIQKEYPNLKIETYEVSNNEENRALLEKVVNDNNLTYVGVPFTVIGKTTFTGYNEDIGFKIKCAINHYNNTKYTDIVHKALGMEVEEIEDTFEPSSCMFNLPLIGEINPKKASLPLISIVIGLVDGFNPCAMWVLLFLISMLMGMKDRKKMWTLGIVFLITSAIIYLLFMIVWVNLTGLVFKADWFRYLISIVALIGGFLNLKNFYKEVKIKNVGCSVTNKKQKKKITEKIKRIVTEKSFILAILGVIALAVSVNIVELACSAGLPVVFTQILSLNNLSGIEYALYIGIYIFFFLLDDLIVFFIAMTTLKLTGLSNKYTKYSHLIGGIIMFVVGLLLILNPGLLTFGS